MGATMRILFVCLGNICRSPTAEGVLRAIAARDYPRIALEIDSAGTADYHVGEPPDRRTIAAARRRGYDLAPLRARQVRAEDFMRFDYVLAMDRSNYEDLLELAGEESRQKLHLLRGFDPESPTGASVPDPYYGDDADFDDVVQICRLACAGLLELLRREKAR